MLPPPFLAARGHLQGGRRDRRGDVPGDLGPRDLAGLRHRPDRPGRLTTSRTLAILLDMTRVHVPVLAGELIEALDPQPGQVAIDCTLGAAGHARLVAGRARPRRAADRHRPRPDRRGGVRRARRRGPVPHALPARGLRRGPADAARRERARRPRLPRPRHVLDAGRPARARLLLRLRRAAGHAHGPDGARSARATPSTPGSAASSPRSSATTARSATPTASHARSSGARGSSDRARPSSSWTRSPPPSPRPRASRGGHPAKRTFQGLRIAVNDELGADRRRAAAGLGRPRTGTAASPRSRSTRSRTGASSASSPTAPRAASARRTCRSASAATSRRPS